MRGTKALLSALLFLLVAAALGAQQPRVNNAKFEARPATPNLEAAVRALVNAQAGPLWIAYAAPLHSRHSRMCCWTSWNKYDRGRCCDGCRLERDDGFSINRNDEGGTKLEGATRFFILLRAEGRRVVRIMATSEDCELDAGGLSFYWLGDARAGESIALLAPFAQSADEDGGDEKRFGQHAVAAIAMHGDPAADRALENFVAPSQPVGLRRHAAFWLGSERGRRGYEILRRLVRDDPSEKVREHAIFALSVNDTPEAVDTMIEVARRDPSTHVRGQALFWLGQKAGRKAVGAIRDAVENDPETEIKKKAVFALTQLPKDEGVPLLIQLARTHRNREVRKQAIFWLGQSKDARALAFFEEILKQ